MRRDDPASTLPAARLRIERRPLHLAGGLFAWLHLPKPGSDPGLTPVSGDCVAVIWISNPRISSGTTRAPGITCTCGPTTTLGISLSSLRFSFAASASPSGIGAPSAASKLSSKLIAGPVSSSWCPGESDGGANHASARQSRAANTALAYHGRRAWT